MSEMDCPTPCVCGEIVELESMQPIDTTLPFGGNLVCNRCWCQECEGTGFISEGTDFCDTCSGDGYAVNTNPT